MNKAGWRWLFIRSTGWEAPGAWARRRLGWPGTRLRSKTPHQWRCSQTAAPGPPRRAGPGPPPADRTLTFSRRWEQRSQHFPAAARQTSAMHSRPETPIGFESTGLLHWPLEHSHGASNGESRWVPQPAKRGTAARPPEPVARSPWATHSMTLPRSPWPNEHIFGVRLNANGERRFAGRGKAPRWNITGGTGPPERSPALPDRPLRTL